MIASGGVLLVLNGCSGIEASPLSRFKSTLLSEAEHRQEFSPNNPPNKCVRGRPIQSH